MKRNYHRTMDKQLRNFPLFRAEVRKALDLRGWGYEDLAEALGYKKNYIQHIMSGFGGSCYAAVRIAQELDIPRSLFMWSERR